MIEARVQANLPALVVENLVCILHRCRQKKDLLHAKRLHLYLHQQKLESHPVLGNSLVSLLVDCGYLHDAQCVFDKLPQRTERAWTSLISGYTGSGNPQHAFHLYDKLQEQDFLLATRYTYLALLNACGTLKDTQKGQQFHKEITTMGLDRDLHVGSTLVDMYTKCSSFSEAHCVFDGLTVRDAVSWAALVAGYAEHGCGDRAGDALQQMQLEGISPDAVTFVCSLKACGRMGAIETGERLHMEATKRGLEKDLYTGSTLVDMYGKCGFLKEAYHLFARLPVQDAVSWNALIAGYAEHGLGEELLNCFEKMQVQGVSADAMLFAYCLKACGAIGALEMGQHLHAETTKLGLESELYISSTLVGMYAKCGSLVEARLVFDRLQPQNAISCMALIGGYIEHGFGEEALSALQQMQLEGVPAEAVTITCGLNACTTLGAVDTGQEIHTDSTKFGLERESEVSSALVDMYLKCGLVEDAHQVFDHLPVRSTVAWNVMIVGYAERGFEDKAIKCVQHMQSEGTCPDSVTFVLCLKAVGVTKDLEIGRLLHAETIKRGLERELFVANTLVDMYTKCCSLVEACQVFHTLPSQDVVSWNALIAGYTEHGLEEKAVNCFQQMQLQDIPVDSITFLCSLKACGSTGVSKTGQEIHTAITKRGLEKELKLGSTLVDMYGKCGLLRDARQVFDRLPVRTAVVWNVLLSSYAEHCQDGQVLNCFERMQQEGVPADAVTFTLCLKACGNTGALETGRKVHAEIRKSGLERDLHVGSTLVDMYGKCGSIVEGREVFDTLKAQGVVPWTAMIKAYGDNNEGDMAMKCFDEMKYYGVKPDSVAFTNLLAVCSQACLVPKGQKYFKLMKELEIEPTLNHYTCMIDLYARSGHVFEALKLVVSIPFPLSSVIVVALLTACKAYGRLELGQRCFHQLVEMNQEDASAYMLMADVYSSAGWESDASKVEGMRNIVGAHKKPGTASIELSNKLYEFVVGVNQKVNITEFSEIQSLIMKKEGHVPNLAMLSRQAEDGVNEAECDDFMNRNSLSLLGQME